MLLRPRKIDIIKVGRRDTVASLARRMPFEDLQLERFRVLNGIAADARLVAGRQVKMVVD